MKTRERGRSMAGPALTGAAIFLIGTGALAGAIAWGSSQGDGGTARAAAAKTAVAATTAQPAAEATAPAAAATTAPAADAGMADMGDHTSYHAPAKAG